MSNGIPERPRGRENETPGKPAKLTYDWVEIAWGWALSVLQVLYTLGARSFVYLFLSLTPTLWSPSEWVFWQLLLVGGSGVYIDNETADNWFERDASQRCLTWEEKKDAISTSVDTVSGWYGPGAYLAWLLTAYVTAVSCIWDSKCSKYNRECRRLDGETLLALTYPLIAVFDIIVRLIRCRIDPGMSAAVFVVISSLVIIGPVTRLSWQYDGDRQFEPMYLPQSSRQWVWVIMRFTCHTIVFATLSEPYGYTKLLGAVYGLLFAVLLYSEISASALYEKHPYFGTVYRSPGERVAAFVVVQGMFMVILLSMRHSVWPATGAKIWELDQAAGLFVTVATLCYPRLRRLGYLSLLERRRSELPT